MSVMEYLIMSATLQRTWQEHGKHMAIECQRDKLASGPLTEHGKWQEHDTERGRARQEHGKEHGKYHDNCKSMAD